MTANSTFAASESSKTSAMRTRGLEGLLDDRRRAMWTFLTWAFCLWDIAKAEDAHAIVNRADADPGEPFAGPQENGNGTSALPTDEPALQNWTALQPLNESMSTPLVRGLPPLAAGSNFDNALPAEAAHPQPVRGAAVSLGAQEHSDSPPGQDTHDSTAVTLGPNEFDAGSEFLLALGLSPGLLYLPLLANDPSGKALTSALTDPVSDLSGTVTSALDLQSQTLQGDVLADNDLLNFSSMAGDVGNADRLFASGRYTDYHIELQVEALGSHRSGFSAISGKTSDLQVGDDLMVAHASYPSQQPGSHGIALPSAVDELVLRVLPDHLI
jgi:hypothetical protein